MSHGSVIATFIWLEGTFTIYPLHTYYCNLLVSSEASSTFSPIAHYQIIVFIYPGRVLCSTAIQKAVSIVCILDGFETRPKYESHDHTASHISGCLQHVLTTPQRDGVQTSCGLCGCSTRFTPREYQRWTRTAAYPPSVSASTRVVPTPTPIPPSFHLPSQIDERNQRPSLIKHHHIYP